MIYVVVSFEYDREPRPGEKAVELYGKKTTERRTFGQELLGPYGTPGEANRAAAEYEDATRVSYRFPRIVGNNYRFTFLESEFQIDTREEYFDEFLARHPRAQEIGTGPTRNQKIYQELGDEFKSTPKRRVPLIRVVEVPKLCSWQSGKKLLTFKNFPKDAPGTPLAWDETDYWSRCLPEGEAAHEDQTVGVHTRDLKPGMVLRNPNGGWHDDLILEKIEEYEELWAENVTGLIPQHPDETKEIL